MGFLAFTAGLGGTATLQLSTPAAASACGALAMPVAATAPAQITAESAILSLVDGVERIDMRLAIDSETKETGLIVPVPATPKVTAGSLTDFTAIIKETSPIGVHKDIWWSRKPEPAPTTEPTGPAGPTGTGTPSAQAGRVQIGPLDVTVMEASNPKLLTDWLTKHKYALSDSVTPLLDHYAALGWSFVGIKLTSEIPMKGQLTPIRLEFPSKTLVYPMALAAGATTPQNLSVAIFSDHRQDVTFMSGQPVPQAVVTWARDVHASSLKSRGTYLTVVSLTFDDPATTVTDDLKFVPAATDDPVVTTVETYSYMVLFGIPIGWLLVGAVVTIGSTVAALAFIPTR